MRSWWRRWFGTRAERAAAAHLRAAGLRILAWNVLVGDGELDLIALDGRTVVFVEVRSTESDDLLETAESVGPRKQEVLTRAALTWLKAKNLLNHAARFDVVLVSWPQDAATPRIEHVRDAFEATGRWQMFS